jgi:hypothetical protein
MNAIAWIDPDRGGKLNGVFVLIIMRRLKQIVLFLLVVITIYSTMLFYLLMSVHADSRLQEIDYLERSRPDEPQKVLYIDRLVPISER